ncbi:MMPL family transporter [Jiangella alba]|uniref:Putative drug exporter of the RND superfamily n=1 Tax=Jiangella alba TaxID=561176 RepID=A0A1H5CJ78_9ACTN|nr:MMPL family transporter [Jiangella alba]SED66742.1 putative drug exporter of the RND superfamily [Jiangella alba]
MAEVLYRIGRFAARRAWPVVAGWVLVLVAAGVAYAVAGGTLSSAITIPGTPTQRVSDRLAEELPDASGGTANVVFHTGDGAAFTDDQRAGVSAALARAGEVDGVRAVVDPFTSAEQRAAQEQQVRDGLAQLDAATEQARQAGTLAQAQPQLDAQRRQLELAAAQLDLAAGVRTVSEDGSVAVGVVVFDQPIFSVTTQTKDAVLDAIGAEPIDGVQVDYAAELVQNADDLAGPAEVVGLAVAAVVLVVMLGTVVAAGLPILTALIGVGIASLGALAFSGVVEMITVTPILGVMLGLAVGIDYSLFILNRHRRQLREGMELEESIGLANGTSGNAVVFAGSTVVIALVALNVTGIGFLGLMGTVAAVAVVVAVLIAVTLTPALLSLIGRRVLPRRARRPDAAAARPDDVRPMRTSRAVAGLVLGVLALAVVAIPAASMRLGLPDGSSEPEDSTQYRAYTVAADAFGAGVNGPLVVVADLPADVDEAARAELTVAVARQLSAQDDVVAVAPIGVSDSGTVAAFQVVPAGGPSSVSTEDLVHRLRDLPLEDAPGVALAVAGQASANIDISDQLADALPVYLAVVIGLSLLILLVVFRSLLVPVIATGGFVLSVLAAFGGVVAIYQWGWLGSVFGVHDAGPVLSFLPILLVGVLFGLAMDYQLFLVSGMREAYVHGEPARLAVARGLRAGRAVVTAAAIIMISVFGGFVFSHLAMVRPIGFGLAFGVLVDAFVVRMTLVPALMHLAGNAAWWLPRWLDRLLPNADVEGAALERRHTPAALPEDQEAADDAEAGAAAAQAGQTGDRPR